MIAEQPDIKHHIQKHILGVLLRQRTARFRDMRAPKTDTNLYSYHLTQLLKSGLVKKTDEGYTLDTAGLVYTDHLNADKMFVRQQPKIVTMLVIQNSDGDTLLQRRTKQPYIDMWTLPNGKLHIDDSSLSAAAQREASEKLGVQDLEITHAGDCYVRVHHGDTIMTVTLVHVFRVYRDNIETDENTIWVQPHKLHNMELAPGVEEIIARTFFRDPFFFEEFDKIME
jgi:ADP-ribose pyrophosphatase YjhB (NUDIX family)